MSLQLEHKSSSSRGPRRRRDRGRRSSNRANGRMRLPLCGVFNPSGDPIAWRLPHVRDNTPYRITQITQYSGFSSSTSVETDTAYSFALTDCAEYAALVAVFDQYRIDAVEIMIVPRHTVVTSATPNSGLLYTAVDYDGVTPYTVAQLTGYENCQVTSGVVGHYRAFTPQVTLASDVGPGTYAIMAPPRPWLDSSTPGTKLYGLKIAITETDAVYAYDVIGRMHISFRNVD